MTATVPSASTVAVDAQTRVGFGAPGDADREQR